MILLLQMFLLLLLLDNQLHHHLGHPSLHFLDHHHLHQLILRPSQSLSSISPLGQAKELISSLSDTITSQLQTIQSQNFELEVDLEDFKN